MALFRYAQVITRRKLSYKHRYKILKSIGKFWLCIAVMVGIHWQFNSLERETTKALKDIVQGQRLGIAVDLFSP